MSRPTSFLDFALTLRDTLNNKIVFRPILLLGASHGGIQGFLLRFCCATFCAVSIDGS